MTSITTSRFWVEEDGSDYETWFRARGPYGMTGHWWSDEMEAKHELLAMYRQISTLSDRELEAANSLYEEINDL